MAQWSEWRTTGLEVNERASGGERQRGGGDVHAVFLCYGADMVGSGDRTCDGGLLLVVWETLACEEGGATLGYLDDDGGLDVAMGQVRMKIGRRDRVDAGTHRAASRTEFATEEEVTF